MVMNARHIMPLEIKTFGKFDVLFNRKSIFTDSTGARVIELLKFLVMAAGAVSDGEIIKALYLKNGGAEAAAKKTFQSDVRNLLKLFAFDNAFKRDFTEYVRIEQDGGNCAVRLSESVRTDAESFERVIAGVISATDQFFLKRFFAQLADLFARPTMSAQFRTDWEAAYNDAYLKRYCACVDTIINKLIELEAFAEVAEVCGECLEADSGGKTVNARYISALFESGVIKKALTYVSGAASRGEMAAREEISGGASVESVLSSDPVASITEMTLKTFIEEAIKNYMVNYGLKYHMALVEVTENEILPSGEPAAAEPMSELHDALEGVLRKKDMYVVFNKNTAVAILYGVRTEYLDTIEKRICRAFLDKTRRNVSISVVIMPVTDVD